MHHNLKKFPCPDCRRCQWCGDDRCRLCRGEGCRSRQRLSIREQIERYEELESAGRERPG